MIQTIDLKKGMVFERDGKSTTTSLVRVTL